MLGVNSTIGVMVSFFRSVGYLPNPMSFLSVLLLDKSSSGGVLRVPQTYATIQEAIDAAASGDIVVVADGVYTGAGNKNLDFKGKAITVASQNGPANCIIDCQGGGRGFCFHSGEGAVSVVSGLTIINGHVEGQWPDACGGGIYCNASSPTIENCVISHNEAMEPGGGIACISSSPTIRSCILSYNTSHAGAGASFFQSQSAALINSVITRNTALNVGGGIECSLSTLNLINSTVAYNSALSYPDDGGGGVYVSAGSSASVVNGIFWENSGGQIVASFQTTQVAYSLIQGGFTGTGNRSGDPLFENHAADDYHLQAGSPCIDSGTPTMADTDIDGVSRPQGAGYDMGACEFHQP